MPGLKIKVGDSLIWKIKYKQSDGSTPVDLTGFIIDIDAYKINKGQTTLAKTPLFNVVSDSPSINSYIVLDNVATGEFSIIIKNTTGFELGNYLVDIEYTSPTGFKYSSKTFPLSVVERL